MMAKRIHVCLPFATKSLSCVPSKHITFYKLLTNVFSFRIYFTKVPIVGRLNNCLKFVD